MRQKTAIKPSSAWREADIKEFDVGAIEKISKDWALIAAANADNYNAMTASWGLIGYLWQKPVAVCFVRPQRFTRSFIDNSAYFTLSFFAKDTKARVHKVFGSESGRDIDKAAKANIQPIVFGEGAIGFEEASETIACKKIYFDDFDPKNFLDRSIDELYDSDYHRFYIGEIVKFYKKK
ncbi:MAG: flavin reductase [Helicobacteraceae bacterium]|jgi:flavin reductase (DIM6/NTAB) family NADH-FMN oxidoreductase RutF|nr:flavin reductase [Helicobacteraceae bacterium]